MAKLAPGDTAPDFTLRTETGDVAHLADAVKNGPVVLVFYPMDNTPGCTAQLCAVRDAAAEYAAAGVTVWGVNNGNAQSHQGFIAKHGFSAPLLVDPDFEVAKSYDAVLGLGPLRFVNRTVVGVGRDGKVVYYKRGSPSTEEILAAVGASSAQGA
jgi:thioredoxin-dependent peroxiredoxin